MLPNIPIVLSFCGDLLNCFLHICVVKGNNGLL